MFGLGADFVSPVSATAFACSRIRLFALRIVRRPRRKTACSGLVGVSLVHDMPAGDMCHQEAMSRATWPACIACFVQVDRRRGARGTCRRCNAGGACQTGACSPCGRRVTGPSESRPFPDRSRTTSFTWRPNLPSMDWRTSDEQHDNPIEARFKADGPPGTPGNPPMAGAADAAVGGDRLGCIALEPALFRELQMARTAGARFG